MDPLFKGNDSKGQSLDISESLLLMSTFSKKKKKLWRVLIAIF